jgi:hypothetical protein
MLNRYLHREVRLASEHAASFGIQVPRADTPPVNGENVEPADVSVDLSLIDETVQAALDGLNDEAAAAALAATSITLEGDQALLKVPSTTDYKELEDIINAKTNEYVRTTLSTMAPQPYPGVTVPTATGECRRVQLVKASNISQVRKQAPRIHICSNTLSRNTSPPTGSQRITHRLQPRERTYHLTNLNLAPYSTTTPAKLPSASPLRIRDAKAFTPHAAPGPRRRRKR